MANWRSWPWGPISKILSTFAAVIAVGIGLAQYMLQRDDSPSLKKQPVMAGQVLTTESAQALSAVVRNLIRAGAEISADHPAVRDAIQKNSIPPGPARDFVDKLVMGVKSSSENVRAGRSLAERKDYVAARNAFAQATRDDPENAFAWANLGAAEAMVGDDHAARTAYERAIALDPENWLAHYNLACLTARAGHPTEALDHLASAVQHAKRSMPNTKAVSALVMRMRSDDALSTLRSDPRYNAILTVR